MHSTVTDNHTAYSSPFTTGGGIWNFDDTMIISHSIVAGNTSAGGGDDLDPGTGTLSVDFSLIGDNDGTGLTEAQTVDANGNLIGSAAGSGIIDPLLGLLANNGGPTETHALLLGSPALDAGDPAAVAGVGDVPLNDQRGAPFSRVFGMAIDIGAVEELPDVFIVDTAIDESDGDFSHGDLSLREALEITNANPGADTIDFNVALSGSTILLGGTQLAITDDITITGLGAAQLTIDAQGSSRVLDIAGSATVGILGLTLTGGSADEGGGLRADYGSTTTLTDVVIQSNTATSSSGTGGGVWNSGNLTITDSTISGNVATSVDAFGAYGGGVWSNNSLTINRTTISGNMARDGGGIHSNGGNLTITDSTISANTASNDAGGVYSFTFGTLSITNSTISANTAINDAGGIFSYGVLSITNSTISANTASDDAGGILSFGNLLIVGSTISGNTASDVSGGVYAGLGTVTIQYSTISGNSANKGGGVYASPVTFSHTIVAGNMATMGPDIFGSVTANFSLIEDTTDTTISGANNVTGLDPLLDVLADNSGATETHALLPGSPALDAGDPAAVAGVGDVPLYDQRGTGYIRIFGAAIDIGAIEQLPDVFIVDTAIDESDGDFSPGDLSLREALEITNAKAGADSVSFDFGLTGSTILLGGTQLTISDDLTLTGLGADQLTVDAQGTSRVMAVDGGTTVDISGLTLTGGSATRGGGLFSYGIVTLSGVVIDGNTATSTSYFEGGGGIWNSGELTITGSTISGNMDTGGVFADSGGGAIWNYGPVLSISGSTITGNIAPRGGGIYSLSTGDLTIATSTISDNTATYVYSRGGGVNGRGNTTITDTTIANNSAYFGGGVFNRYGDLNIADSTISGNAAGGGGGVFNYDGQTAIEHSTITLNTALAGGGVLTYGALTLDHTIVAGNTATGSGNDISGVTLTANWSLIEDTVGTTIVGANNITGTDPMLGPLGDNGGRTKTHALAAGSPAIDAGDPSFIAPPDFDQRGTPFLRVADGGVTGVRIDIGAYERQNVAGLSPLVVDTAADENDGDYSIGDLSLREAVGLANGSVGVDTIEFDPGLTGATILLTLGELQIVDAVTINGLGANNLTIDANNNSRIFNIDDGDSASQLIVAFDGLTLTQGDVSFPDNGGAIRSVEDLSVTNSTISNSQAPNGGGLYSSGNLSVVGSTILGNTAGDGGGIYIKIVAAGTAMIQDSTISGNGADSGGGVYIRADTGAAATISGSTLTGNLGNDKGGGVFAYSTGGANTTIQGSTISGNRGGNFVVNSQSYRGGGISARTAGGATTTIRGNIISYNSGLRGGGLYLYSHNGGTTDLIDSDVFENGQEYGYSEKGGGIYARVGTGSTMSITGTTVRRNIAYPGDDAYGGGIYLSNSGTATITGSTIHENRATGDVAKGGGIFTRGSGNTTITNTTITKNDLNYGGYGASTITSSYGGGLYAETFSGSKLTITGVTISRNKVAGEFVAGGGISLGLLNDPNLSNLGDTIISGSTIERNMLVSFGASSTGGGAGIHANTNGTGTTTVTGTTISENESEIDGGGVFLQGTGTSTVTGSTISGNQASYFGAGARIVDASNVTIAHSTITGNRADLNLGFSGVGGIFVTSSSVSLDHSIVAGNTETFANAPDIGGSVTARFSIVGDDTGGTITDNGGNQIGTSGSPIDPLLGPLRDNGGPTRTHRLLTGSPAIDMGDAAFVGPPATDQRGGVFDRVVDGDGNLTARIDLGAYEIQALVPQMFVVDTLVDEFDADMSSGDFSLREALELANGTPGLADTIAFAPGLAGTIALVLGQLKITDDVTVTGPGADRITIDAQQLSRVLNIDDGDDTNHQSVEISGLTFTRGQARFPIDLSFVAGGAIHSRESLTLNNSVISDSNAGISLGGGLYLRLFSGAAAAITGTTISGNTVETLGQSSNGRGGGIFVYGQTGTTASLTGSTISGNQSDQSGGGIYAGGTGEVTILHSTLTGNTADADSDGTGYGGGIRLGSIGTFTLDHTIVAGNTDNSATSPDVGGPVTVTYSLIGDATGATISDNGGNQIGTSGSPIDPLLGPLQNNGGPTFTRALMAGSPAIDAGDPTAVAGMGGVPMFDQRGAPFDRVTGGRIDIGAVESEAVLLPGDGNLDGKVDGLDYLIWASFFGDNPADDPPGSPANGDYNNDGKVDGLDYLVWASHFGESSAVVASVPAAATLVSVTSTPSQQKLAAVDLALEDDYDTGVTVADDLTGQSWRTSSAFDSALEKLSGRRRDHKRIRAAI